MNEENYVPLTPEPGDLKIDIPDGDGFDELEVAQRAVLAMDAGRMGGWSWDVVKDTVTGDRFVARLLNMDYDAQPWAREEVFGSMHPDDLPQVIAAVEKAIAGDDLYEVEFRDRIIDPQTGAEGLRWLGARGKIVARDADGAALRMIGVNWDATIQKTHELRLEMLAGEMDHRVKNAFAVMRALVNMRARSDPAMKDYADTLKSQIQALASAHTVSARIARQTARPDAPIEMLDLFNTALEPWLAQDSDTHPQLQITQTGGPHLCSPARIAALSLMVYELVTNATKYGALGQQDGRLKITLTDADDDKIKVTWQETCTVSSVADTTIKSGFGTTLVQHCSAMLNAVMTRDLTDNGLHLTLVLPRS